MKRGLILFALIGILGISSIIVTPPAHAATGAWFDNVVVVAMENQDYGSVIGNSCCPFINSLLPNAATIPNYHSYGANGRSINGCSAGCYEALISGTAPQSDGYSCCINNPTIFGTSFPAAGLTWQAYCESGCPRGNDHFPFTGFTDTSAMTGNIFTGGNVSPADFYNAANSANPPNFLWYTPTDNHNMHDNSPATGDSYLQSFLVGSGTLASPAPGSLFSANLFKPGHRTLFILWWDEYDPSPNVWSGPMVKHGYSSSSDVFDEYSTLRMFEDNWGLAPLVSSTDGIATGFASDILQAGQGALAASFTYSPTNPRSGQTITFSGTATSGTPPYTYAWDFGDGNTGSGANPTHTYSRAGNYTVTMTATDSAGHTGISSNAFSVPAGSPGSCAFCGLPTLSTSMWLVIIGVVMGIAAGLVLHTISSRSSLKRARKRLQHQSLQY